MMRSEAALRNGQFEREDAVSNGIGATANVVVHAHGRVGPTDHAYAHHTLGRLQRYSPDTALSIRVDIVVQRMAAQERAALARAELEVDGHVVHAHAEAASIRSAVDVLERRLRRALEPGSDVPEG